MVGRILMFRWSAGSERVSTVFPGVTEQPRNGHFKVVQMLLGARANTDASTNAGGTPIFMASQKLSS